MLPLGEDLSFQSIHHVVHTLPRTLWTQCGKKQAELPCLVVDPCQTKPGKFWKAVSETVFEMTNNLLVYHSRERILYASSSYSCLLVVLREDLVNSPNTRELSDESCSLGSSCNHEFMPKASFVSNQKYLSCAYKRALILINVLLIHFICKQS